MYFRKDVWVKATLGFAIAGAQVYICTQPANSTVVPPTPLATIYSDSVGTLPITQPIITDGEGHCAYYAASGTYTEVVVVAGVIQNVYPDQTVGISGGGGTGTVTHITGPLLVNSIVIGNGGADVASGPLFPGDPTLFLNGGGVFTLAVTANEGPLTANALVVGSGSGADVESGPVLNGNAATYLNGAGVFSVPAGSGTVSSVSCAGLSPLFTASVATPSTTPAISFAQVSQNKNLFFASPNSSAGNPAFRAIVPADVPIMVGDSGTGGVAGLAPAPPAGSAAALKFLSAAGVYAVPAGTGIGLSSVGLSTTATWLTIGNSPLTANGTITLNPTAGLTANLVLATPNGTTGAVSLRALVAADIPSLPYVTTFSAGTLSPLFTTSVATATSTPALTFNLSNAAQNTVLAGPSVGGSGAYSFRALVAADMPLFGVSAATITTGKLPNAQLNTRTIELVYVIDGGGAVPSTGAYESLNIPAAYTITGWVITADQVGSCVLGLSACANSSFPGSLASIIGGGTSPTLSSSRIASSASLAGWTTALAAVSQLQVSLTSVSVVTRIVLSLICSAVYA